MENEPLTTHLSCLNLHHEQKVREMIERRADKRETLLQMVRYAPSPETSDTVLRGMIKDWSFSGICLIAHQPIEEGQEILVNSVVSFLGQRRQSSGGTRDKETGRIGLGWRLGDKTTNILPKPGNRTNHIYG